VVVVVDGVMSIQGDVNNVHKAKDHSHEFFWERKSLARARGKFNIPK